MKKQLQWQSIERLPVAEGRLQELLTEAECQLDNLKTLRGDALYLDHAALVRLIETYEAHGEYVQGIKAQTLHWYQTDYLTEKQHALLASVDYLLTQSEEVIQKILLLAQHYLNGTLHSHNAEENIAWMNAILTGHAAVPESLREELQHLKNESTALTASEQQLVIEIHHQVCALAIDVTETERAESLQMIFPHLQTLVHKNKSDTLSYYCCLYPGFHEGMR